MVVYWSSFAFVAPPSFLSAFLSVAMWCYVSANPCLALLFVAMWCYASQYVAIRCLSRRLRTVLALDPRTLLLPPRLLFDSLHPLPRFDCFFSTEAGNPVAPAPHVPFEHRVEAPPYIQELSSEFAAVSIRVVLRGQSCFYHNNMCQKLFLSSEAANEMYASNKQASRSACRVFACVFRGESALLYKRCVVMVDRFTLSPARREWTVCFVSFLLASLRFPPLS